MKAYQCSKCKLLLDFNDHCACALSIYIKPSQRETGGATMCRVNFEPLEEGKIWHEKFSWEE